MQEDWLICPICGKLQTEKEALGGEGMKARKGCFRCTRCRRESTFGNGADEAQRLRDAVLGQPIWYTKEKA